jgi:hypothetical protein
MIMVLTSEFSDSQWLVASIILARTGAHAAIRHVEEARRLLGQAKLDA